MPDHVIFTQEHTRRLAVVQNKATCYITITWLIAVTGVQNDWWRQNPLFRQGLLRLWMSPEEGKCWWHLAGCWFLPGMPRNCRCQSKSIRPKKTFRLSISKIKNAGQSWELDMGINFEVRLFTWKHNSQTRIPKHPRCSALASGTRRIIRRVQKTRSTDMWRWNRVEPEKEPRVSAN